MFELLWNIHARFCICNVLDWIGTIRCTIYLQGAVVKAAFGFKFQCSGSKLARHKAKLEVGALSSNFQFFVMMVEVDFEYTIVQTISKGEYLNGQLDLENCRFARLL
jgi:hypothetical protein